MAPLDLDSIKVIFFDGDMTLWDFEKVMRHALTLVLQELRQHVPEQCDLSGYFDFVILSQDVGVEKPHAEIFQLACAQASCAPSLINPGCYR